MRKIVREYQLVYHEFVVECDSNEDAIQKVKSAKEHRMAIEMGFIPTVSTTESYEVRSIGKEDLENPDFIEAHNELTLNCEHEQEMLDLLRKCHE